MQVKYISNILFLSHMHLNSTSCSKPADIHKRLKINHTCIFSTQVPQPA